MFVHDAAVQASARDLIAAGVNDSEIARRLGVPRTTVRDWRNPRYVRREPQAVCWRCWRATRPVQFTPADYAELLGLYLGDGHISAMPRTERLRIFLDALHTVIVDETERLLCRCFPQNRVARVHRPGLRMVILSVYNDHLSCLLPQHGPGKKHERPIVLEGWQHALIAKAPWALLKGLVRSDGCVFINRTGAYQYVSYAFKNRSPDIRELFIRTCAGVGVTCSVSGDRVAVYQRASVALLWKHVGDKR